MTTTFCDLTEKEVINCTDGSVVGCVSDLEISTDDCKITALVVDHGTGILSKGERIRIPWENIEKIGCDVIITSCAPMCDKFDGHNKDKKRLFFSKKG